MNIVIDIQGLKDKYNNFIPKEVAVVSTAQQYVGHWVVKPPYECDELPPIITRQNIWIQANHHGICWSEGETSLQAVEIILKKIAARATRIFTRGSEKSAYLTRLTGYFVINLAEDDDAPPFRQLPQSELYCTHHRLLTEHNVYKCSLNNASRISSWLKEHKDSIWEYRKTTAWCVGSSEQKEDRQESSRLVCYEQSTDSGSSPEYTVPYGRRIPSRSDPEGVDETDSIRN